MKSVLIFIIVTAVLTNITHSSDCYMMYPLIFFLKPGLYIIEKNINLQIIQTFAQTIQTEAHNLLCL